MYRQFGNAHHRAVAVLGHDGPAIASSGQLDALVALERNHPAKAARCCQAAAARVWRSFQCQGSSSCSWAAG